ncbi:AraC family transcriptional regulator [uncultured Maribacter sp.]|uniref:helix-turn-helix transcriptional regulator n=1 Tax=uncultured Maribacter sp. TaxID=431308 RepID=UPI0026027EAF|nr:AraC family transcriptional regulator [uncultured Maribacter sp.]
MINYHQSIELSGLPLFSWLTFRTPLGEDEALPIPSEACYAYIIKGDNHLFHKEAEIYARKGHVILSLCGKTMGQIVNEQEEGHVNSIIIHFHPKQLKKLYDSTKPPFWEEIESPVSQYIVQTAATNLVSSYFEGIKHLFQNKEAITEEILILKLKEIILILLQTKSSPEIINIIRSLLSERVFSFKEVVDAHICLPVSIQDLAQLTNMSLSTFKKEFKKIYNSTPNAYIIDKRTEKVANLLKLSNQSISEIGYQCGFNSLPHLSRVFKAKYGVPPTEYRLNFSDKQLSF